MKQAHLDQGEFRQPDQTGTRLRERVGRNRRRKDKVRTEIKKCFAGSRLNHGASRSTVYRGEKAIRIRRYGIKNETMQLVLVAQQPRGGEKGYTCGLCKCKHNVDSRGIIANQQHQRPRYRCEALSSASGICASSRKTNNDRGEFGAQNEMEK